MHSEVDPKAEILQHGPAAEKGVLFSSLVSMSNRHNGRTGMGLVMASKNLRAVVVRGRKRPTLANPKALTDLNKTGPKILPDNPDMPGLAAEGTSTVVIFQNTIGSLPTRNYNEGQFEHCEDISGARMVETILKDRDTCYACVVRCKRRVEVKEGAYRADPKYGGPEYETIGTFGSYCGVNNLAAIAHANQMCNEYAVDTIAAGATIAFAMECFEKGIISKEQTAGIELRFGDADAMLKALEMMLNAEGEFGKTLGQGSERAAQVWGNGADEFLITVKGAEVPAHMPQAKRSLGLIYAVNPFGADHQSSEHDWMYEDGMASPLYLGRLAELDLKDPPPAGSMTPEKIRFAAYTHIFYSLLDTLELCQFVWGPAWTLYGPSETVSLVRAITGWPVSLYELMKVGERRLNMLRVFNTREGFDRTQDSLPKKFFKPLGGTGPTAGVAIDPQELEKSKDLYYAIVGWSEQGLPTKAKMVDLGIEWAAEYLPA
jgi:aldehyde:ferredoxin oxidoreductase